MAQQSFLEDTTIDPDVLEFLDHPPPDYLHLKCPICLSLLLPDAPRLVTCCGNHFCYKCITELYIISTPTRLSPSCPICKESHFEHVPDKNHQRVLKGLKVWCLKKPAGCAWKGELGDLIKHLSRDGDCKHATFHCINRCGAELSRSEILNHESSTCPNQLLAAPSTPAAPTSKPISCAPTASMTPSYSFVTLPLQVTSLLTWHQRPHSLSQASQPIYVPSLGPSPPNVELAWSGIMETIQLVSAVHTISRVHVLLYHIHVASMNPNTV